MITEKEKDKIKENINAMWAALGEQRVLASQEFSEARDHLMKMAEHNGAIYDYMTDIATAMKEYQTKLFEDGKK